MIAANKTGLFSLISVWVLRERCRWKSTASAEILLQEKQRLSHCMSSHIWAARALALFHGAQLLSRAVGEGLGFIAC